jgi:hypothetical protein
LPTDPLTRPPQPHAQGASPRALLDLLLILFSAAYFLALVLDALWHENGLQLLAASACGALNLVQLVVYATLLTPATDSAALATVAACAALQLAAVLLARWAYLGFGWRAYSRAAGGAGAAAPRRLSRLAALCKVDAQLVGLLLVVGAVNGANPGAPGGALPPLLAAAAAGFAAEAAWLALAWHAVSRRRRRLALAAELLYPTAYVAAAALMYAGVYYGPRLYQYHGRGYLLAGPVVFLVGRTATWWHARLLTGDAPLAGARGAKGVGGECARCGAAGAGGGCACVPGGAPHADARVPPELLPLVHGAWLLKLPNSDGDAGACDAPAAAPSPARRVLGAAARGLAAGGAAGRWRFFQLSHDGSTLRWDWRKFALLLQVEAVDADAAALTLTLRLTLDPDLRLRFPDAPTLATWACGLRLLVRLLGDPDGLEGSGGGGLGAALAVEGEGSPSRLLLRLASASGRASAAGLLGKSELEEAARHARRALGLPDSDDEEEARTPAGKLGGGGGSGGIVHLTASPASAGLRRRTPTPTRLAPPEREALPSSARRLPGAPSPAPRARPAVAGGWWRRALGSIAAPWGGGSRDDAAGLVTPPPVRAAPPTYYVPPLRPRPADLEAPAASPWREAAAAWPPPRHARASSDGGTMAPVPEAAPAFAAARPPLPPRAGGTPLRGGGGSLSLSRAGGSLGSAPLSALLERLDSLNAPAAAGSRLWHARFDAGMAGGGADGAPRSPSSAATPLTGRSLARTTSVSVALEVVDFSELRFGRRLGAGASGPVHAAWFRETPVAVKRAASPAEAEAHLAAGWHDNVVCLRGLARRGGAAFLVMELCPRCVRAGGRVGGWGVCCVFVPAVPAPLLRLPFHSRRPPCPLPAQRHARHADPPRRRARRGRAARRRPPAARAAQAPADPALGRARRAPPPHALAAAPPPRPQARQRLRRAWAADEGRRPRPRAARGRHAPAGRGRGGPPPHAHARRDRDGRIRGARAARAADAARGRGGRHAAAAQGARAHA